MRKEENIKLLHFADYKIKKTIIMEQLTYLVNWGKNKETAWSSTNYSLYKALTKYYDMHDINLKGNRWANAFLSKVLRIDGASIEYYRRHLLKENLKDIKGNVFQFSEVLSDKDKRKTYMYVDNTATTYGWKNLKFMLFQHSKILIPIYSIYVARSRTNISDHAQVCSLWSAGYASG